MKKKMIESLPWLSAGGKSLLKAVAYVVVIDGEENLLIDFSLDKPVVRVVITKKDFANYVPENSVCTGLKRWNSIQFQNLRKKASSWERGGAHEPFYLPKFTYPDYQIVCEPESIKAIMDFSLECSVDDWKYAIWLMQQSISGKKREIAWKKRKEKIVTKMAAVPEVTEAFQKWALKQVEFHLMFMHPFYKSKTTTATCSHCKKEHTFHRGEISPGKKVVCPSCGAVCVAKHFPKARYATRYDEKKELILFQKVRNEFCERHFYVWYSIDNLCRETNDLVEIGRIFYPAGVYDSDLKPDLTPAWKKESRYYHKYNGWTGEAFWDDTNLAGMNPIVLKQGLVYPYTFNKRLFSGTRYQYCAMECLDKKEEFMPTYYLAKYDENPRAMEMMVKMGLRKLAMQADPSIFNGNGKPWVQLGITRRQLERLRDINGGFVALNWMRYEESSENAVDDEAARYFDNNRINPEDVAFITDRMSARKIMNYLIRQCKQQKLKTNDVLILWRDYLSMATRLKMNVREELIFKPKDVKKAHDELLGLCGGAGVAARACEIAQKYPDVDTILQSIEAKYEYSDKEYAVVVPNKIEEIIYEGRKLGHCLDKSDIYFDRIERKETFIAFLRKTEDVEQPYYTLEFEPDGTIRQKRTTGDKQDADYKNAVSFIRKWQQVVKKRLSKEDKKLAATSAFLRREEFKELRENQTKVWHGPLAGKLLADVLEADLMLANA